jgi:cytochrome c-type biogenesis protein
VVGVSGWFVAVAAFVAGLVGFSSPCCLPLLPGYVAYVAGDGEVVRRGGR